MSVGYSRHWHTALAVLVIACGGTSSPGSTDAVSSSAGATSSAGGATASTESALSAADSWLSLLDAAEYLESWQAAAPLFENAVSADDWASAAANARATLGKVLSR